MEELIEKTRGPRARIIEGLSFYSGRANTQELRNYGNVPSSTYHFDKLAEQGIIERDGTEYVSRGGEAIAYQLTEFGRDVADELDDTEDPGEKIEEITEAFRKVATRSDQHTEAIRDLQSDVEDMQSDIEDLREQSSDIEDMQSDIEDLEKAMKQLKNDVRMWLSG